MMQERMGDALTPALERLWAQAHGAEAAAAPARKQGLTLLRVVEAAIELAEEGGIAAVSMRSVAQRLGVTAMALYRHVASKDELLVLMRDVALGDPPALELVEGGWRGALDA